MLDKLRRIIPHQAEPAVFAVWYALRPVLRVAFGGDQRFCRVCESSTRGFLSHGPTARRRRDVLCPICLSHDRQRAAHLFLSAHSDLLDGRPKRFLHFAPEVELARWLTSFPHIEYVSTDLDSPHAMLHMDITEMDAPDDSFDVIYCSHVLEHVPDDRKAMRELFRTLRPGGWALVQVPLSKEASTFEDFSVTDPAERERLFWQHDHVRVYGLDIQDRLSEAGFDARAVPVSTLADPATVEHQGLGAHEILFHAIKQA